jgi:hypothetical protein
MGMRWVRSALVLAVVFAGLLNPGLALAQGTAVIAGTVADSGGVVPGATVTASDAASGVTRTTQTSAQGLFRLLSLPPGRYTVKIEMTGFKPITVPNLALFGGETRDLGKLTIEVGTIAESVTVTAEVTPVQTTSSDLQRTITGDQLTAIQVKGRDIFGMLKILPGVVDTTFSRDFASWSSGRGISINGGNSLNKNTTIDGVPVGEEGGDGTTHITPNIDAVGEVNVITSGYTAENGRQSSGLVRITTKSGTNALRGSGWYNMRRAEWNRNDYIRKLQGADKPKLEVNISGYSIGGPVVIPGLFNSRQSERKTYFFLSQEYTDDLRPVALTRTNLPTELERAGNFSQTRITNGNVQPIIDPLTGVAFPGNIIPQNRFSAMGASMLRLLPLPNGTLNQATGQAWTSNDARDPTPEHVRKNTVIRMDTQMTGTQRLSLRFLFDRDDSTTPNRVAPGIGSVNNVFPGNLITGTHTWVLGDTMVHEMTAGFSQNHWGFRVGTGALNFNDYTSFYRSAIGVDPPRLLPYGAAGEPHLGKTQTDQYPYLPDIQFAGGDRAGLSQYRPSGGSGPLPRWNENFRYTFENSLSMNKGKHSYKTGFFVELNSKTEPGSNDYNGVYNFGHNADNPLSTGNGYANALLGNFTSYSERDFRIDAEVRHWQWDAYVQDSFRVTPRLTLDYGVRATHAGAVYEVRGMNSAFDPAKFSAAQAGILYRPYCASPLGPSTTAACGGTNRRAVDPRIANPTASQLISQAYVGSIIPGTGSVTNGQFVGGLDGKKDGWYYDMPALSWAPRFGMAWDVTGDQKTAIRASGGIFYNFINRAQYLYNGGPMISRVRQVLNSSITELQDVARRGQLVETPQQVNLPAGYPITLRGQQLPQGKLSPETNYQGNVAFQRDIGFKTVAEVAWVGNFGRKFWRAKTTNNIAPYAYANSANLFRNEAINANFLRRDYPGLGPVRYLTTDDAILDYNAMQMSVNRRLDRGLQVGMAYTLSKSQGIQGWDALTEEIGGKQGIRDRYYGPPNATQNQDRRHVLSINYSYAIPNPLAKVPVVKWATEGWEAAGVTQWVTGNPLDPTCGTNIAGINNADPSLSGVGIRCELTGEPINSGFTVDSSVPEPFQPHFNMAAFRRPQPSGGIGNLGNAPLGSLRHPSNINWDLTLSRRLPIKVPGAGRPGNLRIQAQFYNVFDLVQYTTMNASYTFSATGNTATETAQYTQTTAPFNFGVTMRLDF